MNQPPQIPDHFSIYERVAQAMRMRLPIVALETAVVTHGLPRPQNLELALAVEDDVRGQGATPATIALLNGQVHIGLSSAELEQLANAEHTRKISARDFGIAIARRETGGTTVAATLHAAQAAGIRVFATGGIGGVHRGPGPADVSADLPMLGRTPVLVVCAGAKSILDLPATLEYLETVGVPVIGYQTDEFPAFFSRGSGLPVTASVETPDEAAAVALAHWSSGQTAAVLVVAPPPAETALDHGQVEQIIQTALAEARERGISGPAATPFLLTRVNQLSGGTSMRANLDLLRNNASIAAQISVEMAGRRGWARA